MLPLITMEIIQLHNSGLQIEQNAIYLMKIGKEAAVV